MTTKDQDLECYGANLEASDKAYMIKEIYSKINFPYDDGDAVYTPVGYGDVCHWAEKNLPEVEGDVTKYSPVAESKAGLDIEWKFKRHDISEQPIECIEFVYSLISK